MKVQVPRPEGRDGGLKGLAIIYEDNHLIAVFKPAGILSQGDKTGDISMYDMVKDYIRIKKGKPSFFALGNARPVRNSEGSQRKISNEVFLGLIHRLDRPVSGIILFAKTSKGASRLSEQFRNHQVEKTYHAIVLGKPEKEKGVFRHFLIKDEKLKKARKSEKGIEASLYYKIIKSNKKYSLLKIKIDTGKFHQIRAQLSLAGFPILGDLKYKGEKWDNHQGIALCATNLVFKTATENPPLPVRQKANGMRANKIISLKIDLPKEWEEYINISHN